VHPDRRRSHAPWRRCRNDRHHPGRLRARRHSLEQRVWLALVVATGGEPATRRSSGAALGSRARSRAHRRHALHAAGPARHAAPEGGGDHQHRVRRRSLRPTQGPRPTTP
jgi:hypothetical protein